MSSLRCGEKVESKTRMDPTGRPYFPKSPGKTGGTRVCPPLCGVGKEQKAYPTPLWHAPILQTAQAGPEGLGGISRRGGGGGWTSKRV